MTTEHTSHRPPWGYPTIRYLKAGVNRLRTLEPLARGIPVVSTAVGDASTYYLDAPLARFCVPPRDPGALARGVLELASNYANYRRRFAENGRSLADFHSGRENSLVQLVDPLSVQPDETAHALAH